MTEHHRIAGSAPARFTRRAATASLSAVAALAAFAAAGRARLTAARPAAPAAPDAPARPPARPNIVLIVCDDLALSLYDRVRPLRRLLERGGLRFANAVVAAPSCAPSRASLLTGRYPQNHGVLINTPPDGGVQAFAGGGAERASLGLRLQAAGYRTALIGKYLNEYEDDDPARIPPGWNAWHAWAGGGKYDRYLLNDDGILSAVSLADGPRAYETDRYAALARQFVRDNADGKPFFLYLAPHAPHLPAIPAARHAGRGADLGGPRSPAVDEADVSGKPAWIRALPRITAGAYRRSDRRFRAQYESMLAVADLVRSLLAALRRSGELGNTWIFFTSDNGFFYGEHRIPSGKGSLYEEGVRVPLVVLGPGVRRGTSDLLVSNVDLLPTILGLARVPADGIDGRSCAAALAGPKPRAWRGGCFTRFGLEPRRAPEPAAAAGGGEDPDDFGGGGGAFGLRGRDWSFIRTLRTGEEEFYDLAADPAQLVNAWPSLPEAARALLRSALDEIATCRDDACRAVEDRLPATAAALRAMTG